MGRQPTYNNTWDIVFKYLQEPNSLRRCAAFYNSIAGLIKDRLLKFGFNEDLEAHSKSVFSDLLILELRRYKTGDLVPEKCTAKITSYYFPIIKNLCYDYVRLLKLKFGMPKPAFVPETILKPGIFEGPWGEHKGILLAETKLYVQDWIAHSGFEEHKKQYLRDRFLKELKFSEILEGCEKGEFERDRKWIRRQGERLALEIATEAIPAIIDCYKLPISRDIDPKIIEKYLFGSRVKISA